MTIRRFADLASARLAEGRPAPDLGCGPGIITCGLARWHPEVNFEGIDQRAGTIARARQHAEQLRLAAAKGAVAVQTSRARRFPGRSRLATRAG